MGHPTHPATNLVVLTGTVTNDPTRRSLRTGGEVANFDLATSVDGLAVGVG